MVKFQVMLSISLILAVVLALMLDETDAPCGLIPR
jgi:hypothetical protein